ncbi:glycoside hydrolase family 43 C-terminal domain-containing protein [Pedobacter aquatilis]|uniref:glycoside hydrolase family 43 C-terminal domain-containing protein n=1 Tax=Pedobacter aquatilis TaxID=351343 RepID=UPI00292D40A7|nr:glycoside hydrolase family 43 C-terminal domain-containing protein [Pedobacter aquatilis]
MKILFTISLCLIFSLGKAQTAKELIGKWKLVKQTNNGISSTPDNTFQVFMDGGVFNGINGNNSRKGKWKLSDDNKQLTIKISIISIAFNIDYFDTKKRIISSSKTGTLEYEKVEE